MNKYLSFCCIAIILFTGSVLASEKYDLVIKQGRVIDPESGTDAILNIGIKAGIIAVISEETLEGESYIDASNLVVSPGFIDLHSHAQTQLGQRFQALDGVTTSLELEAGAYPSATVGSQIADKALINFGASAGYFAMRIKVMENRDQPYLFFAGRQLDISGPGFKDEANDDQIEMLRHHLNLGLDQGGLGVGLLLDYLSDAINDKELQMIFAVAAKRKALITVHIRRGVSGDDTGLKEVIKLASETGAAVHICHIHANAMSEITGFLSLVDQARDSGVDISAEAYPYNAGSTSISAEVFSRDWRKIFAISYKDVQVADTGERFTESMWNDYRINKPNTSIIHHYGKETWTQEALSSPGLIIASDASPIFTSEKKVHPRGIGTFTRVLGHYVRDKNLMDLPTAIEKMTLLPAKRMESVADSFSKKGRLQAGADADIVIFNPTTITDNATYLDPYRSPSGIKAVIVNGRAVVHDGEIIKGVYPGRFVIGNGR